jgi:hypothetical protein
MPGGCELSDKRVFDLVATGDEPYHFAIYEPYDDAERASGSFNKPVAQFVEHEDALAFLKAMEADA